ncbi:MAG: hypothetical protein ACRCY4_07415, partial [Brevinema sp.]
MKTLIMVTVLALSSSIFAQNTARESAFGVAVPPVLTPASSESVTVAAVPAQSTPSDRKSGSFSGSSYALSIAALPFELARNLSSQVFAATQPAPSKMPA